MTAWHDAANSHGFEVECRIRHLDRPNYRWFSGRATPLLGEDGRIAEWLGTFTDVNDLRVLQERQGVLLAELQHRVRNILAVMRSMASRTAANSESVEEFAQHLEGRLGSLARTQVILTRQAGAGINLEDMVRDELLSQAALDGQVDIEGPEVILSPKAAEVLTLTIHELTTNAVKYGALTKPEGKVQIRWEVARQNEEEWLTLHWIESGVGMAAPAPRREGFGTELIEQRVPYELHGSGTLQFLPGGVRSMVTFPLRRGDSVLRTDARAVLAPNEA